MNDEILEGATVDTGIFSIGTHATRVTLYSQQVRAINLVYALVSSGKMDAAQRIAIVGGGAAGLTAASSLALLRPDLHIDLYERESQPLHLQHGCTKRSLHPHIFDWPRPKSLSKSAGLPILNWTAGTADNVARSITTEFNKVHAIRRNIHPIYNTDVTCIKQVDGAVLIKYQGNSESKSCSSGYYNYVFLTVGFGAERTTVKEFPPRSYWSDTGIPEQPKGHLRPTTTLVSGNGDGGLIDFTAAAIDSFDHMGLITYVASYPGAAEVGRILLEIETKALHTDQFDLMGAYTDALLPLVRKMGIINDLSRKITRRNSVILNTRTKGVFRSSTAILNRYISFLILNCDAALGDTRRIAYVPGALRYLGHKDVIPEGHRQAFEIGGTEYLVDDVYLRHGPDRGLAFKGFSHLESMFSKNYQTWLRSHPEADICPVVSEKARRSLERALDGRTLQVRKKRRERGPAKGPSPDVFRSIVRTQTQFVLNTPIVPWLPSGSPSLRAIWPELLIDPTVRPQKKPLPAVTLSGWRAQDDAKRIVILGSAGAGKSTALRKLYLEYQKEWTIGEPVPLMIHAADLLSILEANKGPMLDIYGAPIGRSLVLRYSDRFYLFVDGMDEVEPNSARMIFERFILPKQKYGPTIVCCRTATYEELFSTSDAVSSWVDECLVLESWDPERDAFKFINSCASKFHAPHIAEASRKLAADDGGFSSLLRTPFYCVLIVVILLYDSTVGREVFLNSYTLYLHFYKSWATRELHRGTSTLSYSVLQRAHWELACILYQRRGRAVTFAEVSEIIGHPEDDMRRSSAFRDLILIEQDRLLESWLAKRFLHETLLEFFVARAILDSIEQGGLTLLRRLKDVVTYEVNSFIRGAFRLAHDEGRGESIAKSLYTSYQQMLLQEAAQQSDSESIVSLVADQVPVRDQILYYMGRLGGATAREALRQAFRGERHLILKRSAALGAILNGDEATERAYITSLIPGSEEDIINRSAPLVYFGDAHEDLYSFRDDGFTPFENTKSVIIERLGMEGIRELRIRLWDLVTLRSLLVSRRFAWRATQADIDVVESLNVRRTTGDWRNVRIADERRSLLSLLRLGNA